MKNSRIEWTDHTFNPWIGCTAVSPGCDHCYARRDFCDRKGIVAWGPGAARKRTSPTYWRQPLRWDAEARAAGTHPRVFCASLADWLDPEVPEEWLLELIMLIVECKALRVYGIPDGFDIQVLRDGCRACDGTGRWGRWRSVYLS